MEGPIRHAYKSVDDHEIKLDIYPASKDSEGLRPAIMFIHGGALIMGARTNLLPSHVEVFNDNGIDFVSIDYRLAPETPLPEIVSDVEDAWSWLQANAASMGIDSNRIAVMGHSAGGYLALTAGFRLEPKPSAVVSIAGYGDLLHDAFVTPSQEHLSIREPINEEEAWKLVGEQTISESGPGDSMQWFTGRGLFYLSRRQQGDWLSTVSSHDQEDQDWFRPYMPILNITPNYPPTMLLHGEPDTDVPITQSEMMQQRLVQHGVAHEFLRDPDWHHAFLYVPTDPSVGEAFGEIVRFVESHL